MSFSVQVKDELCEVVAPDRESMLAELSAMVLFSRAFERGNCVLQTENRGVADRFIDFLVDEFDTILTLISAPNPKRRGTTRYTLAIDNSAQREQIRRRFFREGEPRIDFAPLENESNRSAFIRGAFVTCGSINDPHKEYHLEFVVAHHDLAADLASLISELDIPIKLTRRKNSYVLYIKESENIEDLLTLMGATKASLEIMEIKVMKDVRNKVNRVTNCETANIGKTVAASTKQVDDINLIIQKRGLDYLPDNLKEVALARLDNPEMSLNELVEELHFSISKSGLNHRLKRIGELADGLRKG